MDRGQRAFLIAAAVAAAGWLAGAGTVSAQGAPSPPAAATPGDGTHQRTVDRLVERRQRDLAAEQEAQKRIEQLPPDERAAFARNLQIWRELPPDERQTLRGQADERMKAETEKALQDSGLRLNNDQREVFALRYRQERRRLERELQQKLQEERARRLPVIIESLKREFAEKSAAPAAPAASATPAVSNSPVPPAKSMPSVSVPAATPPK